MHSKLQRLCAQLRASAEITENDVRELIRWADEARNGLDKATRLFRGSRRGSEVIAHWSAAHRHLTGHAVPTARAAATWQRELAAALCGDGASPTINPLKVLSGPPVTLDPIDEPHGGHGGPGAPPPRTPFEDISRDRVDALLKAGASPDDLPKPLVDLRYDWIDAGGHAGLRHDLGVATADKQEDRCMNGVDPASGTTTDWEHGGTHRCGRDASAFVSKASLVFAEGAVFGSEQGRDARVEAESRELTAYSVEVDASTIFGADFSRHISGWSRVGSRKSPVGANSIVFPDTTRIVAHYSRRSSDDDWYLYSMYPIQPKRQ